MATSGGEAKHEKRENEIEKIEKGEGDDTERSEIIPAPNSRSAHVVVRPEPPSAG